MAQITFIWGEGRGSVWGNWWHMQSMNIIMRLDLEITFHCLWGICKNCKGSMKSTHFNNTRHFSVKRTHHRCLALPDAALVCGSGTVDKTTKHNRNIYTESGMSVSIQLLNFFIPYTHTYTEVYVCVCIHTRLKAHWVDVCFLLCSMFWCLCARCLFVYAVCVMTSVSCCEAARQEQCVATGKILSLN